MLGLAALTFSAAIGGYAPVAVAPLGPHAPDSRCAQASPSQDEARSGTGYRRLDRLPPAYHQLAVRRTVAGCEVMTVVVNERGARSVTFRPVAPARLAPLPSR